MHTQSHLQNWMSMSAVPWKSTQYLHENLSNPPTLHNEPELHETVIYWLFALSPISEN